MKQLFTSAIEMTGSRSLSGMNGDYRANGGRRVP